tara:strand:- start:282 stop:734 length:453 start_codon:yes stop_codon:yes gene_type:complete
MKNSTTFTLENQRGEKVKLSDELQKHKVLLYFYPKDMTPGCTTESIGFSKIKDELLEKGVKVFGISADDVSKHKKFCEKENLSIDLLADIDHEVAETYGVWQEKSMFGKKYHGISRESFLINQNGAIEKHWEKVKPLDHPQEVLDYVNSN